MAQLYGFLNDQIFSARHSTKQRARWIDCWPRAFASSSVTWTRPTALYQNTEMPTVTDVASASGLGLGWAARNRGVTHNSKCLLGIEAPLSLTLADVHTRKPATLGETIFGLACVIPTGWLGCPELPGKDRSRLKSPTSARDCTSHGELPAALLKPWCIICATELKMQLPASAVVLAAAF